MQLVESRLERRHPIALRARAVLARGVDGGEDLFVPALEARIEEVGQTLFEPPSVFGWDWETSWISSATLLARFSFARDVVGAKDANSTEFDLFTNAPVIDFMPDQREMEDKGGTMRLGLYPARLEDGSKARDAYGTEIAYEIKNGKIGGASDAESLGLGIRVLANGAWGFASGITRTPDAAPASSHCSRACW